MKFHIFANHSAEQAKDVPDRLVKAEVPGLQDLPPREGQQLTDQRRDAVALHVDLFEVCGIRRIARGSLLLPEFCPAQDGADHVVEIMRDAAGQLADGLEFLRLPELLLEYTTLGDVPRNSANEARLPRLRVLNQETHVIHGDRVARLMMAEPQLALPLSARENCWKHRLPEQGKVLGGHVLVSGRLLHRAWIAYAKQGAARRVDVHHVSLEISYADEVAGILHKSEEFLLFLFGSFPFGDILRHHECRGAPEIFHGVQNNLHVHDGPVFKPMMPLPRRFLARRAVVKHLEQSGDLLGGVKISGIHLYKLG